MLNILQIVDDELCFQRVRELRWPEGVKCPHCESGDTIKKGFDDTQRQRQRYGCKGCGKRFDDLTATVFEGHHQPLKVWILCLYLMGLNLSNLQISKELGLNKDDARMMANHLREGVVKKEKPAQLQGQVECDEVYIVAGHKGQSDLVKKKVGNPAETG